MGSVWSADHLPLGIEVAVKFIATGLAHDDEICERFRREARATARVYSPNVVRVFDHGTTTGGIAYLVMERLIGESLSAHLKRRGRLTVQQAGWIVEDVCRALTSAHRQNIVHRDIKPANLFLAEQDGRTLVKLLDFGVAHTTDTARLTQAGTVLGSPSYMSPEQLLTPSETDERADLWGLAAVIYRVITAEVPFYGENLAAMAMALSIGKHKPPSELWDDIPTAIDGWFATAFHRDIEERFSCAEDMAFAFVDALNDCADEQTEDDTLSPPPRRRRSLAGDILDEEGSTLIKLPYLRDTVELPAVDTTERLRQISGSDLHVTRLRTPPPPLIAVPPPPAPPPIQTYSLALASAPGLADDSLVIMAAKAHAQRRYAAIAGLVLLAVVLLGIFAMAQ